MTAEENNMMCRLFTGPLFVIKLNHINNLLKDLNPDRVTKDRRGLLRAQYAHLTPKWQFALNGGYGVLRVYMTVAGTIPLAVKYMADGSSLITFNAKDRNKLILDYAGDLTKLGVPMNDGVIDDPRNRCGVACFGNRSQVTVDEVTLGNKLVAVLLSGGKKNAAETEAYMSLAEIIPIGRLMNKGTQRI